MAQARHTAPDRQSRRQAVGQNHQGHELLLCTVVGEEHIPAQKHAANQHRAQGQSHQKDAEELAQIAFLPAYAERGLVAECLPKALVHQLDQHRHGHQTGEHGAAYPGDQLVKAVSDKEQAKQVGT